MTPTDHDLVDAALPATPGVTDLLVDLVRVDTTNPGGDERAGVELLARLFEARGLSVVVDEYQPGNVNLTAEVVFGDGEGPVLLLNSHIDVVPSGDGWASSPFSGLIADGRVHGRGSADAKGSLAAMAVAVLSLLDESPDGIRGRVLYTAVGDEEGGSTGARALVSHVAADACVVGEPTNMQLLTAHKGSFRPVVEVRGVAAHAANPHRGANAVTGTAGVLAALAFLAERLGDRRHALVGAPTLTPVLITGGEAPNAVPERCRLTIDRRLVPGETAEQALGEIEEVLVAWSAANAPLSASVVDQAPTTGGPSETPSDHPFITTAQAAMTSVGESDELGGLVVNCDMTTFRGAGIPTLVLGPGTLEVMHAKDEHVEIDQLERAVVAYRAVIAGVLAHPAYAS